MKKTLTSVNLIAVCVDVIGLDGDDDDGGRSVGQGGSDDQAAAVGVHREGFGEVIHCLEEEVRST